MIPQVDDKPNATDLAVQRTQLADNRTHMASERTDLAVQRTVLAMDRTLMAWVRTGLSITSFGFTVYKILQALIERPGVIQASHTPRQVGLFMTAMGVATLMLGVLEYLAATHDLRQHAHVRWVRPSLLMASIMAIVSAMLFVGIYTRVV